MTFNDSSLPPVSPEDAAPLVATVAGSVLLPGDAGYDDERAVFNLNHELVPAVIVVPESAADVQAAVAFAAGQHRPVLVKTTGHQMVGQAHGAVVIATHRMNDVTIDAVGRTARVGAGAIWSEVIAEGGQGRAGSAERVESHGGSLRLHPGRRSQPDPRPLPRLRRRPCALARRGHRGRRTAACRRGIRTRPVLGAARRQGQLRSGHRAGIRPVPGVPPLRRRHLLPR